VPVLGHAFGGEVLLLSVGCPSKQK
jgi:hypothetical protein